MLYDSYGDTMDKKEKFIELAEKRVNNTMKQIQLIGNLANKKTYDYSEEQVNKIFATLKNELKLAENRFKNELTKKNKFELR